MQSELIVALDFSDFEQCCKLVEELGDEVSFYKIGLEMMACGNYFKMIEFLKKNNKKIFADLKLYDIANTVGRAVANLSKYEVDLLTIHSSNFEIMNEAAKNKGKMKILAVTILTSLDNKDLQEIGFDKNISLSDLVLKKAELSIKSGVDGVVSSVLEANFLRQKLGNDFLIATPAIRLENDNLNDQKRVANVENAIKSGSNFLIVGRPITQASNPVLAAKKFNDLMKNEIRRNS